MIALEDACQQNATSTIPNKQMDLVAALQKAKAKMQLGVQTITTKDEKKRSKEFKKRG